MRLVKMEVPEFKLIKDLKDQPEPISVEELKVLAIDYNQDLDMPMKDIPAEYAFKDENPENPPSLINEEWMETDKMPLFEASIQM